MDMKHQELIGKNALPKNQIGMNKIEKLFSNITNPNSTYIKIQFKFQGYRKYHLHGYIDTGASICVAHPQVLPPEKWSNTANTISVQIANTDVIKLNKVARNITVEISGEEFLIPTIYQQATGVDFLIGNNFLNLYSPFVQYVDRIYLTKNKNAILVQKVGKAYSFASESLMETYRKPQKRGEIIPKKNIAQENFPEQPEIIFQIQDKDQMLYHIKLVLQKQVSRMLEKHDITLRIMSLQKCQETLEKVASEDPLDTVLNKSLNNPALHAELLLIDPTKVIRVKPMNYTISDREEFRKQITELKQLKLIKDSKSPHSSPAFMVENEAEKRRGKKRMVVNYKELNKNTIDDGYFLPKKEELFNMIRDKKWFSTFDCKSGFWQIPLKEECRQLTAFSCPNGQYEWQVVPFGLKQAPGIFQRRIDTALQLKEPNSKLSKVCTVYVDDIIVFSSTEQQHYEDVLLVLQQCYKEGIILSKKKAKIAQTRINFLGLEIENGKILMQPHILTKISQFPSEIKDKTQLQRFLGILNYVEGYVERLAEIRKPLQAKLKKDITFKWEEKDTHYVDKIKKKLVKLPELYHPSESDEMILETDASGEFWGAVLKARNNDKEEKLCRYSSGTFQGAERNYHSNEKEYLAVKKGITKFRIYLISKEFLVRTDNKNFGYFLRTNISGDYKQGRLIRWQQWFNYYKFRVEHIKGIHNSLADSLTREFSNGSTT